MESDIASLALSAEEYLWFLPAASRLFRRAKRREMAPLALYCCWSYCMRSSWASPDWRGER